MPRKVTAQLDLLAPNPSHADLKSLDGRIDERRGVKYIGAPHWDEVNQRWTCLADVRGMLCLVEVSITVEPVA